jgi:hypothetical protein
VSADSSTRPSLAARPRTFSSGWPAKVAVVDVDRVVAGADEHRNQPYRQALVYQKSHAGSGSGNSRSSTALAA